MSTGLVPRRTTALSLYLADDGNVYAFSQSNGQVFPLGGQQPQAGQPAQASAPAQQFQAADGSTIQLCISDVGGDLIVKALTGPNAGKTANLTYGKWV